MDKKTQLLLGVGVVGVAAYLIWKNQQPKANQIGTRSRITKCFGGCCFKGVQYFNQLEIGAVGAQSDGSPCVKTGVNQITMGRQNFFLVNLKIQK